MSVFGSLRLRWGREFSCSIDRFTQALCAQDAKLNSVDENRWSAADAVQFAVFDVVLHFRSEGSPVQGSVKTSAVHPELAGVFLEGRHVERFLALEQQRCIFKKLSL